MVDINDLNDYKSTPDKAHLKHNYSATGAPTTSDDITMGYSVGSFWFNTTDDEAYFAIDVTEDAAVWQSLGAATAESVRLLGFFDTSNDGAGSGLDADLLDGNEATDFVAAAGDTMTGLLQFSGTDHAGIKLLNLTTTQRDDIVSPAEGMLIYNSTDDQVNVYADGAWGAIAGGGANSKKEVVFDAAALQILETNFPPLEKVEGTNVNLFARAFDDTTEEYANGKFQVPGDVDTAGTVTFRAYVSAKTAAASKNVALTFGHLALNDSEDWDPSSPYTEEDADDQSIGATQDDVTEITWTETISNLGWSANDLVLFRLSRFSATTNNLSGDMYLFTFAIEIPRSVS